MQVVGKTILAREPYFELNQISAIAEHLTRFGKFDKANKVIEKATQIASKDRQYKARLTMADSKPLYREETLSVTEDALARQEAP